MKKYVRFLTIALILLLLTGCGAGKNGDRLLFSGGSGSEGDPYRIATAADLRELAWRINDEQSQAQFVSAHYVLTADIDLDGKQWEPIQTFTGVLDGAGHTVSGLKINYKAPLIGDPVYQQGLIGTLSGTVQDLTIHNSAISVQGEGVYEVGAVAGKVRDGVIRNCHTTDSVSLTSSYHAGGICGSLNKGSEISGCTNAAAVTGTSKISSIGGIAVRSACPVVECSNSGTITCTGDAGGIVCTATAGISDCVNSGDVTADGNAGGIVDSFDDGALNSNMNDPEVTLLRCTNSGDITSASDPAGGIAVSCRTGKIADCTNSGNVTSSDEVGGIFAYFQPSVFGTPCVRFLVSGCVNTGTVTGTEVSEIYSVGGICGRVYESPTELIFEDCENRGAIHSGAAAGGILGEGTVQNLRLTRCANSGDIFGVEHSGGIVGTVKPGEPEESEKTVLLVENCVNSGSIYAEKSRGIDVGVYAAGILGHCNELMQEFSEARFEGCENRGTLGGSDAARGCYLDDICGTLQVPEETEG